MNTIAELCKGSTADSDSVCLGSNPSSAAIKKHPSFRGVFLYDCELRCRTQFLALQGMGSHTATLAVSGVCVGIPHLNSKTYGSVQTNRTLAVP